MSPVRFFLSPGPVPSRPVPGVEWAEGGRAGGPSAAVGRSRDAAFGRCLGEVREAYWSREGRWRAAKARPSGFRRLAILRTCARAQDCQSTELVPFGRCCVPVTWPVLGRNYREPSEANGRMGAGAFRLAGSRTITN